MPWREAAVAASASDAPPAPDEAQEVCDTEGASQESKEKKHAEAKRLALQYLTEYLTAVRYRITVKRMLVDFVLGSRAIGVEPSE